MTLKQLRQKRNLTQRELAKRLGVSQSTVAGWEAGTFKPNVSRWKGIARATGVGLGTMLRMWT